ncbi:MAG: tetratricopeptide repeat protein [Bacteroidetes bacterium]|nr:tetratricopeptide repeat protein [Bacteroidota bacterium]
MKTHLRITAAAFATLSMSAAGYAQTLADAIRQSDNEQYEKAKASLRQLLVKEPTNGDLYFYMGDVYMKQDMPDSAGMYFTKGASVNPTNPLALVGKGRYLLYTGKQEDGKKAFAEANALITTQKNLPKERIVAAYLEMAESYTFAPVPEYDAAIILTQRAQKTDEKNAEVFLVRGDALGKQDPVNGSPAIECYKQAANLDPKSCKANLRIGQLYFGGQNYDGALEYFEKATAVDPNFAPAWRAKGEAYFQKGQFEKGAECYRKYLELNDDPFARYRYVANLYLSKQYGDVVTQSEQTMQKDSTLLFLYRLNAYSNYELGNYDPALVNINKFMTKATEKGSPKVLSKDYEYRGKMYLKKNMDSLAMLDFEMAYQMDTSRKELFSDLGAGCLKLKRYGDAAKWYKMKGESFGWKSINDLNTYGRALFLNKEYNRADSVYAIMMQRDPKGVTAYYWRGRCYSAQNTDPAVSAKARPFYEQFVSLAVADKAKNKKDLIVALKWLGDHYIGLKNFACAKACYELIKELEPENATAKTALEDKQISAATAADINTCFMQPMLLQTSTEQPQQNGGGQ